MPTALVRLWLDNSPATDDQLGRFGEIRVDQSIGMATEAELELPVATDDAGAWAGLEDGLARPFARVRVEVQVGDAASVPLIDGPVVGNRYELTAATDVSRLVLVVHDDSVLLNREEKVVLFENQTPPDIASALISEYGLTPDVGTAPDAGAALDRVVIQRGTNMQLLRELARRFGMFAYVKPGATPGQSVGVFQHPQLSSGSLPQIVLLGPDRNINNFSAEFDALRPITAKVSSVKIVDKSVLTGQTTTASLPALGDTDAHSVTQPAAALLARTREEQTDLDSAATAAVDLSSWAYAARGELDADTYAGVLSAHDVVEIAGVGGSLSGDYLIARVTHVINDAGYKQRFALHRNARSSGTNGGVSLLSGIF